MELCLKLSRQSGNTLPINYQYALSAWIYKVIARADEQYSAFLHEKGFSIDGRRFKMFTFSQLDLRPYEINGNQIRLLGNEISLTIRFLVDSSLEHFIRGLFMHQHCGLGDKFSQTDFQVTSVETKAAPVFQHTMRYQCLSPIVVAKKRGDGSAEYLSPEHREYGRILIQNLVRKQQALALHQGDGDSEPGEATGFFRLLNTPRKKGILIKEHTLQETKVIGYLFHFELSVSPELHEIGYFAGFGEKNSMGFGTAMTGIEGTGIKGFRDCRDRD